MNDNERFQTPGLIRNLAKIFLLIALILTALSGYTLADAEMVFDLRKVDLNHEAYVLSGIMEFYESQMLDPGKLQEKVVTDKRVTHFPEGIKKWSRAAEPNSDLYGTLRTSVWTSSALKGTYLTLRVDLPAQNVKIWVNGTQVYSDEHAGLLAESKQTAVFKAEEGKQDILIQFSHLDRHHPGEVMMILGNSDAINRLANTRFVGEMLYVLMVAILLTFGVSLLSFGYRGQGRSFRRLLMLILLVCLQAALWFLSLDGNALLISLIGNNTDIYMRMKYGGMFLVLPVYVIYLTYIPGLKLDRRLVRFSVPFFWFLLAIVALGSGVQFAVMQLPYMVLFEAFCLYVIFKSIRLFNKGEIAGRRLALTSLLTALACGLLVLKGVASADAWWISETVIYLLAAGNMVIQVWLAVEATRSRSQNHRAGVAAQHELENETLEEALFVSEMLKIEEVAEADEKAPLKAETPDANTCEAETARRVEAMLMAVGARIWVLDKEAVIRKTIGFSDLEAGGISLVGTQAGSWLFPGNEALERTLAHACRRLSHKLDNEFFLTQDLDKDLKMDLDRLPVRLPWHQHVWQLHFSEVLCGHQEPCLLIHFEEITEQVQMEKHLATRNDEVSMISRVVPEFKSVGRVVGDFEKYIKMDILEQMEVYDWRECLSRILSYLRIYHHLFCYYRMPGGMQMTARLMEQIAQMPRVDKTGLIQLLEDDLLAADILRIEQICGMKLGNDQDRYTISCEELDRAEVAIRITDEADLLPFRALKGLRMARMARTIEGYAFDRAQAQGVPCEKDDIVVEFPDLRLPDSLFWDLHKMLLVLIDNAVEHGFETQSERLRKGKSERNHLHVSVGIHPGTMGECLIARISDDGRGIVAEDVRSRLFADRRLTFEEVAALPEDEVLKYVIASGFSMAEGQEVFSRGYGLHRVSEVCHLYGGELELESKADQGCRVILKLPYQGRADYGSNRIEPFVRGLEQTLRQLADTVGLGGLSPDAFSFYPAISRRVELEQFTSIQNLYWHQEIQVLFTANGPMIDTVSRVHGVQVESLELDSVGDVLSEIVNMAVGGTLRSLTDMSNATKLGALTHVKGQSEVLIKGTAVYVAHFEAADLKFTAFISVV